MTFEQASNNPSEAHPRFQFSLRTLMAFTAAVALLFGMWSWLGELGVLYYFQGIAVCVVAVGVVQRRIGLVVIGLLVLVGIHAGLTYSIRHSSIRASCCWHAMKVPMKVVVEAEGYGSAQVRLQQHYGTRHDLPGDPLQPIIVKLRRKASAADSSPSQTEH